MRALAGLRKPVDIFFDKVTVNAPEKELRANRLRLLQRIGEVMDRIAIFAKIDAVTGTADIVLAAVTVTAEGTVGKGSKIPLSP